MYIFTLLTYRYIKNDISACTMLKKTQSIKKFERNRFILFKNYFYGLCDVIKPFELVPVFYICCKLTLILVMLIIV